MEESTDPSGNVNSANAERDAEFLSLLSRHELQLAACIHAIVPVWQDAEEVLQATRVTLWRRFDDFQLGTNFLAWARAVARNEARAHARRNERHRRVFGEALIDTLLDNIERRRGEEPDRWSAFLQCCRKLGKEARDILRRVYVNHEKIKDVATDLGRSMAGTYAVVSRIRRGLMVCVQERLGREQDR